MHRLIALSFIVALLTAATGSQAQDVPEFPKPQKEHEWLQQLTGQWEAKGKLFIEPGKPPIESSGTESVRSLGGFWIIAENKSEFLGRPFTGLLTLGYDTQKKQYVGTWIDSMTGHLWTYHGAVDKSGQKLTLEAKGPCPKRPGELTNFREAIELKSEDHKVFSSSFQEEDGTWTTMMKIDYRRKK